MEITQVDVKKVKPNPFQARKEFTPEQIEELALSIEQQGLQHPVKVRPKGGMYEIADGERRWRAFKHLNRNDISVIIKEMSDSEMREAAYISNAQRENLKPYERENAIFDLWNSGEYETYRELDKRLGYTRSEVKPLLESREYRLEAKLSDNIDTFTIKSTKNLDPSIREKVIAKVDEGTLAKRDTYKYAGRLNKMPIEMQKAVVDDKVDIEDVEPLVDIGISEEQILPAVEELTIRKRERDTEQRLDTEFDKRFITGKSKGKFGGMERTPDQKKLDRILGIRDQIRWWSPSTINQISNEVERKNALEAVRQIEKFCIKLLEALAR